MKVLSIIEPYASLIREHKKLIETRSWKTNFRGRFLIHASASRIPKEYRHLLSDVSEIHPGYITCSAELVDCITITEEFIDSLSPEERKYGFYSVGRYAWILKNIEVVEPVKANGHLGLWNYRTKGERNMRQIINGRMYNTATSKLVGRYDNKLGRNDFGYVREELYKKRNGEYFIYGEGGAASRYAVSAGQNCWCGGEKIIPLTEKEARDWTENFLDVDDYIKEFGEPEE